MGKKDVSEIVCVEEYRWIKGQYVLVKRMTAEAEEKARTERAKKTRKWREWIKQKEQEQSEKSENIPAWGYKNFYCRKHQFYGPSCKACMELNGVCDYARVFKCSKWPNFNPCPICERKNTDACKDCRENIFDELSNK